MPLAAGTRLGPYEIGAQIGAGGMGEVYHATDGNLGRHVAIKILPDTFAQDPERLARFEREARSLASLNHPNIAIIYGFEKTNGVRALVMEFVEGETLADRIARGSIPVDETLPMAKQIAQALEAAHEQGIIHRDLKPANVKVRPDGTVKVLDFGLAKAMEPPVVASASLSISPTITTPAITQAGLILGTAAYMAPEQAKGRPADKRSDVWAFGCVLYEMLIGRRAFVGEDVSDTLAAVLRGEPEWAALPGGVPASIRRLLRRCLQKDRRNRLADIADARLEIDDAMHSPREEISREQTVSSRRQRILLMSTLAVVALVAVGAVVWATQSRSVEPLPVLQLQLVPPDDITIPFGIPSISPDGRLVAFIAIGPDGLSRVYLRALDTLETRPIAGTEGVLVTGASLVWSPDSRQLVFQDGKALRKVAVAGGLPQSLCDLGRAVASVAGGSWNRDGVVIFGTTGQAGIMRVPASGGPCQALTHLEPSETNHLFPSFLPDGRHFLYLRQPTRVDANDSKELYVGSLDAPPESQKLRHVLQTGYGAQYVAMPGENAGRVLFVRDGTLFAQPFDAERLELSGDAVPVAANVGTRYAIAYFTASTTGSLVYRTADSNDGRLTWFDREGRVVSEVGDPIFPGDVSVSRDGSQASFSNLLPPFGRWVMDLRRGIRRRLGEVSSVTWSPDAQFMAYAGNGKNLYRRRVNSVEDEELLLEFDEYVISLDWSHDGRFLMYSVTNRNPRMPPDIWALPLDGDKKPFAVVRTPAAEFDARLSPGGRWLAYISNESGSNEIYVRAFVPPESPRRSESAETYGVSKGGVASILGWRNDGRELWYLTPDLKIMSVEVTPEPTFQAAEPKLLFEMPPGTRAQATDGNRFLLAVPTRRSVQVPITMVQNWPALMKN